MAADAPGRMVSHRLGSRTVRDVASSIESSDPERTEHLLRMLAAGLAAVEPEAATAQALRGEPTGDKPVALVALGKSAPAMARGAARALGGHRVTGLAVSDHSEAVPAAVELMVTGHPYPDHSSVAAGERLLHMVSGLAGDSHLLFLISGGGSSLVEIPQRGLDLADMVDTWRLLSEAGVPIEEMNTVRTHLSAVKGGRLAAAAIAPATTILISDVPSGRIDMVASGPTVAAITTPEDALGVLARYGLTARVPRSVVETLARGSSVVIPRGGRVIVAADGGSAAEATAAFAREGLVLTTDLRGHAREAALGALGETPPGAIGVFSGETTVEVIGRGLGGRNQEAALAAAIALDGIDGVFVSLGTDGIDGPTDAAGALVDGSTIGRIRQAGVDPEMALADNDSNAALDAGGALIRIGPTGTNVADLWLVDRRADGLQQGDG